MIIPFSYIYIVISPDVLWSFVFQMPLGFDFWTSRMDGRDMEGIFSDIPNTNIKRDNIITMI